MKNDYSTIYKYKYNIKKKNILVHDARVHQNNHTDVEKSVFTKIMYETPFN